MALFKTTFPCSLTIRHFSTTSKMLDQHFKLAVVGGGSGGSAVSSMFSGSLGKQKVAVIEPQTDHYYQPLWTLVGAGIKTLEQSRMDMKKVLKSSTWIKDKVTQFEPEKNRLVLGSGDTVTYDYLLVAVGLQHRYDLVKGLEEGLRDYPEVCTNYDVKYVQKTIKAIQNFQQGAALFTMNMPIKCPGAPQKIMYLAEENISRRGKRDEAEIIYTTPTGQMLGAKKYADVLYQICQKKGIKTNFFTKLVEIDPKSRVATFDVVDKQMKPTGEKKTIKYDFIHVGPPFSPPDVLRQCSALTDRNGFLSVDKHTLQSTAFPNVFGIGDCTNLPNAKTAAAVASEAGVVRQNLNAVMKQKQPTASYIGYSSCPIPTGYKLGILAEFDYNWAPLETFPFLDQAKQHRLWYYFKAHFLPPVYWLGLIRGKWEGPSRIRKLLRLGM